LRHTIYLNCVSSHIWIVWFIITTKKKPTAVPSYTLLQTAAHGNAVTNSCPNWPGKVRIMAWA